MLKAFLRLVFSTVLLATGALPSFAQATAWQIDPAHSAAQFTVRHLMIANVKGDFIKMTGVVNFWNATMDGGGVVVGDEVTITVDVEMFNKAAPPSLANGGK